MSLLVLHPLFGWSAKLNVRVLSPAVEFELVSGQVLILLSPQLVDLGLKVLLLEGVRALLELLLVCLY